MFMHHKDWFLKFDFTAPAVRRGLPITHFICRMELQDILVNAVGHHILSNKSKVVDFVEDYNKVTVILENGMQYEGDILVGADGIRSEVRSKLFGAQEAKYSDYTCYTGLTNIVPPCIDSIGYQVFLGMNRYFAVADVGNGKMQWYAFVKESPSTTDPPGGEKERLLKLFCGWCNEVVMLISETPGHLILRRNIYDIDMIYSWGNGRVTLVGDAAHAMQPNLGQGGCMAIEDCYQLILELDKVVKSGSDHFLLNQIVSALKRYEKKRMLRVSIVHAVNRMASRMVFFYQPYMEFGFGLVNNLALPHPAFHVVIAFLQISLPQFMSWTLTGHWLW
ncbi:zeaxanthin epoxidase, chloroplastic-like [Cornus florida]|uniref:zeaxanthin epoxidase, chloroplastic-like n=1 Tax=Cornus florida TaxID=4283 RepID=UPI0028990112|nr:zeaxanthin epoxidase, chloroplastic-like [Cornus florida]